MPATPVWPTEPHACLFLEEETPATLAWVAQQNQHTRARWLRTAVAEQLRPRLERAYLPDHPPVFPHRAQGFAYHVLVNGDNPEGLLRRMPWSDWRTGSDQWEHLLDLKMLGEQEGQSWQLYHYKILDPDGDRALILLSPGGSDAVVVREFDFTARAFVDGGFCIPEAGHHHVSWIDRNTVYVAWDATDPMESPHTHCGFPYQVRRWSRGTALQDAPVVFSGEACDDIVTASFDPESQRHEARRFANFFDATLYYMDTQEQWHAYALPTWIDCGYWKGWLILSLRKPSQCGTGVYPSGTLLAVREHGVLAGDWASLTVLFAPSDLSSAASWRGMKSHVLVSGLHDLRSTAIIHTPWQRDDGGWEWTHCDLTLPEHMHAVAEPFSVEPSDELHICLTGYLTPTQHWLVDLTVPAPWDRLAERVLIGTDPATFDDGAFSIRRGNACSRDGTRIPYIVVSARGSTSAPTPCLLTGYGGFGVSLEPHYLAGTAIGWLEAGGCWVQAHIRGGGEFGERWHQAAQRDQRQRCFDDFIAVAEALIASGLTTAGMLGIQGASNGGLLVAACMVQRPELFGAVVCERAVLDMQRYPQLHLGSIWMDEYGDPAEQQMAAALMAYSPVHRVQAGVVYPPILLTTSTNDDRVHPAHARKMVAVMQGQGHKRVWYLEQQDGGHGLPQARQSAEYHAMVFGFLQHFLMRGQR